MSTRFVVEGPVDLSMLRRAVTREARNAGVPADREGDVAVAVTEAVSNALTHARPPAVVECGLIDGGFVCEISDTGVQHSNQTDLRPSTAGLGMSLIRGATDAFDMYAEGAGSTVRLRFDTTS